MAKIKILALGRIYNTNKIHLRVKSMVAYRTISHRTNTRTYIYIYICIYTYVYIAADIIRQTATGGVSARVFIILVEKDITVILDRCTVNSKLNGTPKGVYLSIYLIKR